MPVDDLRVQKQCRIALLECLQEASNIVAKFGNIVLRRFPVPTQRISLLIGTVRKLQESTKAILLLGRHDLADEMNVLLRTQVELVVNSCSLQHSSDEELNRYLYHDAVNGYIALQDLIRANGIARVPQDLIDRVTTLAEEASQASGLPLDSRSWSSATRTLKQRADAVDKVLGLPDFAGMMATVYVTGSGYTHAGQKTVHKHVNYLVSGYEEHPLAKSFHVNNTIHGAFYILLVLGRYMSKQYDFSHSDLDLIAQRAIDVLEVSRLDYAIHRKQEKNKTDVG